jgi:1-acyl-sn-glycerol-3-phosphate acyltransferase
MGSVAKSIRSQVVSLRPTRWFLYIFARIVLGIACRVDANELGKVPSRGPLIAISNHTGSLEVPLLFTWLYPRPVTGWAKVETWDNRMMGLLFDTWGAIPLHRGEADMFALRTALDKLQQGYILGVAPEGTRNRNGKLLRGHPGVVSLALRSKAPILPVVHWGGEKLMSNLKRLRRTDFLTRVGKPFMLNINGERLTRDQRQQVVDEMMYQVAALLPEEYRGEYSDMSKATVQYLTFDIPVGKELQ